MPRGGHSRDVAGLWSALSDGELWRRAGEHDDAVFGELFERHADAVYNHCFRRTALVHGGGPDQRGLPGGLEAP